MLGILLIGLFTMLFGAMLLILFFGAQRIEEELGEQQREAEAMRAKAAHIPRFFVITQPAGPHAIKPDDAFLWQVQQYLDAEQTVADEFVLQPSMENLYRESGKRLTTH